MVVNCPWIRVWPNIFTWLFFPPHPALQSTATEQDVLQELAMKPAIIKNPVRHFAMFLMNHWINIWPAHDFFKLELTFLTLFSCPLMLWSCVKGRMDYKKTLRYSGFTEHVFSILTVFNKVSDFLKNCKKRNHDFQKKEKKRKKQKKDIQELWKRFENIPVKVHQNKYLKMHVMKWI